MKQLFLILCFVGVAATAFGQSYTLKGKIQSASTKEAIIGATVLLQSQSDTTKKFPAAAGANGDFQLSLPAGHYTLRAWAFNFAAHSRTVILQKRYRSWKYPADRRR